MDGDRTNNRTTTKQLIRNDMARKSVLANGLQTDTTEEFEIQTGLRFNQGKYLCTIMQRADGHSNSWNVHRFDPHAKSRTRKQDVTVMTESEICMHVINGLDRTVPASSQPAKSKKPSNVIEMSDDFHRKKLQNLYFTSRQPHMIVVQSAGAV